MGWRVIVVFAAALSSLAGCARAPAPPLKEYVYPALGFAISFHAPPKAITNAPASAFEDVTADRDDLVNVIDGTGSTKSEDQALSDAPAAMAQALHGTLGPITYAATGKVIGREFLLNRPDRSAARVRIFVFHQHLYELVAWSKNGPDDPDVAGFLESFRFL